MDRYKAISITKGFTQTYGVDCTETFAPVTELNIIRILLSLATNLDWPLHQLEMKNAFLNRNLEEEVYMNIPPRFINQTNSGKVCMYSLKNIIWA